jgi:hypothetical protein
MILIVLSTALTLFGLAGLILLVLGVRGWRIDDHPVCRRCRFDLVGVYPAIGACPECGAVAP